MASDFKISPGATLTQSVRVALTGKTASPGIFDVVLLLGKKRTIDRLQNAL